MTWMSSVVEYHKQNSSSSISLLVFSVLLILFALNFVKHLYVTIVTRQFIVIYVS